MNSEGPARNINSVHRTLWPCKPVLYLRKLSVSDRLHKTDTGCVAPSCLIMYLNKLLNSLDLDNHAIIEGLLAQFVSSYLISARRISVDPGADQSDRWLCHFLLLPIMSKKSKSTVEDLADLEGQKQGHYTFSTDVCASVLTAIRIRFRSQPRKEEKEAKTYR